MKVFEQIFNRSQVDQIEIPDHMVVMIGLHHIATDILELFQYHEEVMVTINKDFHVNQYGDIIAKKPEVTFSTKRWTFKGKRFVSQVKYKIDSVESIYVTGKIAKCCDLIDDSVHVFA